MATLYEREGSPYWWARFRIGRQIKRLSTGETDRKKAQKEADRLEQEARKLFYTAADVRFEDAVRYFKEHKNLKPSTWKGYNCSIRHILRILGNFPLRLLEDAQLETYVSTRRSEVDDATIRRDLAALASIYEMARRMPNGPRHNPVRDYDKRGLAEAKERTVWLRLSQFERLLEACESEDQRHFVLLLVDTGFRLGEAAALRWDEVDFEENRIVLGNLDPSRTKRGDVRITPMSSRLRDVLSTRRSTVGAHNPWVFPSNRSRSGHMENPHKWWNRVRDRAGLPGLRIHDLRHTFASWTLQAGVSEIVVQDLLGHATRSMTKRYAKPSERLRQEAIATLEESTKRSTDRCTRS